MNINKKTILGLGSAALSLLAASDAQAIVVITTPTAGLNLAFDTDGSTSGALVDSTGTVQATGLGVGYDPGNSLSKFPSSPTPATAQSVYSPLITDSSAAGAFQTIIAGSSFQLGLHAYGSNAANTTQPVTLLASLFQYNPSAAAGTVPIGAAIFQNLPVGVLDTNDTVDHTYYSSVISLANSITAGTEYVLAVDGGPSGGASPTDFGTADRVNFNNSGLPSADSSIYRQYFLVDNNSGDTGGAYTTKASGGITQPLGYQFFAAAAPEPSEVATGALIVFGMGAMLLVARKRKATLSANAE